MASSIDVLARRRARCRCRMASPHQNGTRAVIAAGTGLGQAYLHRVDGGWRPVPTEAGHADFAARTDRELELVRMLRERYGRAEVEQVLSGQGLLNLHRFTHRGGECPIVQDLESPDAPALVSQAALGGRCQCCAEALRMFVSAYGAEAGNLALRTMATAGVYIGGGIARKILPALTNGSFIEAFRAKDPLTGLVAQIPVHVILNEGAGLLGAAVVAAAPVVSGFSRTLQQLREELVDHAPLGIDHLEPVAQLLPPIAVRRDDVLLLHERALIEQRNAAALMRPLVERLQEGRPRIGLAIARRVNRIERDDVAVPGV